jgi:hypothetical protein
MRHPAPSTAKEIRLAAGCQFRGADDALPIVVANLVSLGFDLIYLIDHLNDSIPLPLLQRIVEGRSELRVIRKETARFSQSGVHSLAMRLAQDAGAHAYVMVDADEFPAPASSAATAPTDFRDAVHAWLLDATTDALLIPRQNYLQRRDVERWGATTIAAPTHRILGEAVGVRRDSIGFLGQAPHVRAMARLKPGSGMNRWVRLGAHRVYGGTVERHGGTVPMEVSPDLVILHLPYPSRWGLHARLAVRTLEDSVNNRSDGAMRWEDVSSPVDVTDPHPGPPVRTAPSDAFARMRDRLAAAGLLEILADEQLATERVAMRPTELDTLFTLAADLLAATVIPRNDGIDDAERGARDDAGDEEDGEAG